MNSYNENLHSSTVSSLNEQEVALQKVKSEKDAATFSMYYAQGARITAAEDLQTTTKKYKYQQKVNEQAIVDSDLSTNVLASSNNVKSLVALNVTNASVAAANVQISANAILKLASDIGSLYSMVNAADFDTEIYAQSKTAYELMNETAYMAELTSQLSMEATSLVAEIPSNTLADKATTTDAAMKSLLASTSGELEATTTKLYDDSKKLADANTTEKGTEGTLEDTNSVYNSTTEAYNLSNLELNHNLTVKIPKHLGDATEYTVSFDPYKSPFNTLETDKSVPGYPVQDYYIFLVKYTKSKVFSISDAEGYINTGDAKRYIKIKPSEQRLTETIYISELYDSDGDAMALGTEYVIFMYAELRNDYKKIINTFDNYLSAASAKFTLTNQLSRAETSSIVVSSSSTDNDSEIMPYQTLNFYVWENPDYEVEYRCMFLPDNADLVTGLLTVEGLRSIEHESEVYEKIADKYDPKIADTESQITSTRSESKSIDAQIDEVNDELSASKAEDATKKQEAETKKLEDQLVDLKKSQKLLEVNLTKLTNQLKQLEQQKRAAIASLESSKFNHIKPGFYFDLLIAEQVSAGSYLVPQSVEDDTLGTLVKDVENIVAAISQTELDIDTLQAYLEPIQKELSKISTDINEGNFSKIKKSLMKFLEDNQNIDPKTIGKAYSKIVKDITAVIDDIKQFVNDLKSIDTLTDLIYYLNVLIQGREQILNGYSCYKKQTTLKPETADNFGNTLINGDKYIPAVLSISNAASVEENSQYNNALSSYQLTRTFRYNSTNKIVTY